MIKSKVIDILKCFSAEDIKKFSDYLNSPLFNKRKIIINLFNAYKKYFPSFEDKNFTKEKIFRKIMQDKKYNDNVFRNLNSILLKNIEDYLSYCNYSKEQLTVKRHLLAELNFRNLLSVFENNLEETRRMLEKPEQRDMNYFFEKYNLYLQKDLYNSFVNKFSLEDIFQAERNLIIFFLMKFMEIQNYILYECRILGLEKKFIFNESFIDELMKKVPEEISGLPQIQIYYNAFKLEQTSKEIFYRKLGNLLDKDGHKIGKEKLYNNYTDMIDFIKRTKPRDDIKTVTELFNLRKNIIEKGLFTENFITNMFFLNLVRSGIRIKKFEWVLNFIDNYKHLIIEKYRESTAELSYAYYYFEKKDFQKSLRHASVVRYEDSYYNLEIKNLYSRIYYEQDLTDALTDFLNSYRMYISKNRSLTKSDIQSHSAFISIMNKLLRIKETKKYHKLFSLQSEIESKEISGKLWISEKIEELKSRI